MSRLISYENAKFYPFIKKKGADSHLDILQVGLYITLQDGSKRTVYLVPSLGTDEGPGTASVFLYEDDAGQDSEATGDREPITHLAWEVDPTPDEEAPSPHLRAVN